MKSFTRTACAAVVMAAACLTPGAAQTAVNIQSYTFSGRTTDVGALSGSFTLSYDTVAKSFTLDDISFAIGTAQYTTTNTGVVINGGGVYVGGIALQPNGIGALRPNDDFETEFSFNTATGTLTAFDLFKYVTPSSRGVETATNISFAAAAVPEPATWAMMILGMSTIGMATRRSRKIGRGVRFV